MGLLSGGVLGGLLYSLEGVNVILLSGQSNLDGEPQTSLYSGPSPVRSEFYNGATDTLDPVVPGASAGYRAWHNPTIHMLLELERLYPTAKFVVVEQPAPGMGFLEGGGTFAAQGSDRLAFMSKIERCKTKLQALGRTYKFVAHLMHQGEAECFSTSHANNYKDQLLGYAREIRWRTAPTLPFLTVRQSINNTRYSSTAIRDTVRATQSDAEVASAWFDLDNGTTYPMFADQDGFVRHFTATGYANTGKAWANHALLNPANAIAQSSSSSLDVQTGSARTWDFTAMSALPVEFSITGATALFSGGLNFGPSATPQDWGKAFVTGPIWNPTRTLEIYYRAHSGGQGAMGLANDPATCFNDATGGSLCQIRYGVYTGNVQMIGTGNYPDNTTQYAVTIKAMGPDVQIVTYRLNTNGSINSAHVSKIYAGGAAKLANAKIMLMSNNYAMRVYKVIN
jgi:Carbohydrate esterase, sialic acid-specific acetylesterase